MFVAIGRELSNATTRTATSLRFQTERQRTEQGNIQALTTSRYKLRWDLY